MTDSRFLEINIAIAYDHQLVIDGLKSLLEKDPNLIFKAHALNGVEALNLARNLKIDLFLMEIEILKLIAEGLSNKEMDEELFISHRTVDTHRTNLMKKLDVHNIAGLIRFAIKSGLVEA